MRVALIIVIAMLFAAPARADVRVGVSIPIGGNPAPAATPAPVDFPAPSRSCIATPMLYAAVASQAVDSLTVSNARNRGSQPATWAFSSKSWALNFAEHAALDGAALTLTRRWSCTGKAIIYFGLFGSAINDAARTEFPR